MAADVVAVGVAGQDNSNIFRLETELDDRLLDHLPRPRHAAVQQDMACGARN